MLSAQNGFFRRKPARIDVMTQQGPTSNRNNKMTAKTLVLPIAVSISLLLAGYASKPTHTPEQLAHGVKFEGLQADIPLDPGFSRPHQVAHVFGIPVKDLDPETKNIATIAERRGLNSFISGAVDNGSPVVLLWLRFPLSTRVQSSFARRSTNGMRSSIRAGTPRSMMLSPTC